MKSWLLQTRLFSWAYRQGGIDSFPLAQKDILETMADDLEKRANELADNKLKELLSIVDISHVIEIKGRQVFIGGELADQTKIANLKAEADFFTASELWKLLNETLKEDAQKTMFTVGEDAVKQLATGRTILYTLSLQRKVVDLIQKLSTTPNP